MLLRTVDFDAPASAAISSSRLVHCPSDNITEKITRITRSSAGVKMLKDAFGNSRPSCRIDAHLLRDTRTHLMASQDVVGPGWLQLGVSNYPFVGRTDGWVHGRVARLLDDGGLKEGVAAAAAKSR